MSVTHTIKLTLLTQLCAFGSFLSGFRLPGAVEQLPYDVPYYLNVPTYERSGQAVHPDILYDASAKPRYMLAFTPYPFSRDEFENPSVAVSKDGLRFREERPRLNPLAQKPPVDHNDDPDLFYYGGEWHMLYLETMRPERQNLVLLDSGDRIHWSRRTLHSANLKPASGAADPFIVSPSFIQAGSKKYLFYVNISESQHRVEYVPLDDGLNPDFGDVRRPVIESCAENPWHIDILSDGDAYYMLLCCVKTDSDGRNRYSLSIAKSADLAHWRLSAKKLLPDSYRASAYIAGDDLVAYFSRQTGAHGCWKLGVYKTKLSGYF